MASAEDEIRRAESDLSAAAQALRRAVNRRDSKTRELVAHDASKQKLAATIDDPCPVRQRLHDDILAMECVIDRLEHRVSTLEACWVRLQGSTSGLRSQEY